MRSGWGKCSGGAGGTGVPPVVDDWFGKDSLLRLILSGGLREVGVKE